MVIVSDSGPILSFSRADFLDLLQAIVTELIVPTAVYKEIIGDPRPADSAVLRQAAWVKTQEVQNTSLVDQLPSKLHRGEREAIALAAELGAMLLVDEREARKEALRLGIEHFGSLRILKEAKDRGLIEKLRPVLDKLISSGTYIALELYSEFLDQMGEASGKEV